MAQADGVVANGSGSAVRADINTQLAAAFTNHSGGTQPSTTYAYQNWADTSASILKLRNSNNSGYINLRTLDGKVIVPTGTAASPGIYFDANTDVGIFYNSLSSGSLSFTRNNVAHVVFGRTLQNQTDAFVFGPAAYRTSALNPTNGNNDSTASGVCIANDASVHIGTHEKRPVTLNRMTSGSSGGLVNFNFNGSFKAAIQFNGAQILYNATSDYRLKENITQLTGAKDRVNQLNPVRFNFIESPDQTVDGFLAHEAQASVPQAITGEKDAVFEDGSPKYQLIDKSQMVPLLTAALKEAFAEIAALTARIETLEAG